MRKKQKRSTNKEIIFNIHSAQVNYEFYTSNMTQNRYKKEDIIIFMKTIQEKIGIKCVQKMKRFAQFILLLFNSCWTLYFLTLKFPFHDSIYQICKYSFICTALLMFLYPLTDACSFVCNDEKVKKLIKFENERIKKKKLRWELISATSTTFLSLHLDYIPKSEPIKETAIKIQRVQNDKVDTCIYKESQSEGRLTEGELKKIMSGAYKIIDARDDKMVHMVLSCILCLFSPLLVVLCIKFNISIAFAGCINVLIFGMLCYRQYQWFIDKGNENLEQYFRKVNDSLQESGVYLEKPNDDDVADLLLQYQYYGDIENVVFDEITDREQQEDDQEEEDTKLFNTQAQKRTLELIDLSKGNVMK